MCVAASSVVVVAAREPLFRDTFVGGTPHVNYAVTPDGQHFVTFGSASGRAPEAVVVVNRLAELRAALAGGPGRLGAPIAPSADRTPERGPRRLPTAQRHRADVGEGVV